MVTPSNSNTRILLFALAGSLLLSSCNVVYIPSMQNVPLLKKKGEFQGNITPANFQVSYSPVTNLGVMVNAQLSGNQWDSENDFSYNSKRQFVEGGIGYNRIFDTDKIFEVYGGGGYGSLDFTENYDYIDQRYSANMIRKFIQPSIGFSNDYVDIAFSTRFLQLNFINLDIQDYTPDELKDLELNDLDRNPFYFVEPAITIRGGYKFIKAHFQYLYSVKLNPEPINRYEQYIFFGISLRF